MMASINLGNKIISKKGQEIYVIAEIGQNHQGDLELAKYMIKEAKKANCDCVKFQKSNLKAKFTGAALKRDYCNENSWGTTYGEHKEFLEFSDQQYLQLQKFCADLEIDFTASAMDECSLEILDSMDVPFIKIGSGDANNYPLLQKAAKLKTPLVISTGMQNLQSVDKIVQIMKDNKKDNFALLHCVSAYPTPPEDCNLQMIPFLAKRYSDIVIGYSGHELGLTISKAAVLCGAKIIERHFTLNKNHKGSDHRCSLEPNELTELIQGIALLKNESHHLPISTTDILRILGNESDLALALRDVQEKKIISSELPCKKKLGKSIVAANNLEVSDILTESKIAIKVSEPNGIPAECYYDVIGKTLQANIPFDDPIMFNDLKQN